jgi:hypothetical protein
MEAHQIHAAVTSLLNACYESDDPGATLHAELERLSASGEWSQLQLTQLQAMALQTVKSIVSRYNGNGGLPVTITPTADNVVSRLL